METPTPTPTPVTVVFRTFGSDLPHIASVVTAFARGEHPDYPSVDFPPFCLPERRLYQGRWKVVADSDSDSDSDSDTDTPINVVYQLWNYFDERQLVASGDAEILELLGGNHRNNDHDHDNDHNNDNDNHHAVFGIRDDYDFWKRHQWTPTAGKPIWVPKYQNCLGDSSEHDSLSKNNNNNNESRSKDTVYDHHLLFDDNIHNLPNDGIACVRREATISGGETNKSSNDAAATDAVLFESVHGADMEAYHGVHLVRVPTVEPVLNPHWYIQQIEKARNRLQHQLQSQSQPQSQSSLLERNEE
mmetsp:Transcript_21948/g.47750  ORF Transcript_21948/g.47750 Transcript_21948/m.47750 type:complete len:302 (-) Transcript_21948:234-1139(-)